MSKAVIRTTIPEIVTFWESRVYEENLGVDWCDAHERCWRCGEKRNLERCHIVPAQEPFLGSDCPENLVLLCKRCHGEAPSCVNSKEIWAWIKKTRATFYDIYWEQRDWEEMKRVYGLDLEKELSIRDPQACLTRYREIFDLDIGMHLGQRPFSVASKVYAWNRVLTAISPHALNSRDELE